MKIIKNLIILFLLFINDVSFANTHSFEKWLENFKIHALKNNISESTFNMAMSDVVFLPKVIKYDRFQPEFYEDTKTYVSKRSSELKVKKGKDLYKSNKDFINSLSSRLNLKLHCNSVALAPPVFSTPIVNSPPSSVKIILSGSRIICSLGCKCRFFIDSWSSMLFSQLFIMGINHAELKGDRIIRETEKSRNDSMFCKEHSSSTKLLIKPDPVLLWKLQNYRGCNRISNKSKNKRI